jgi:4-diphosphocytidyl-2-C-methyl-D-erythritol kinase
MVAFPNCKINLGLNITRKRDDGFHDLETLFLPIPFTDILEIITNESFEFITTGAEINTKENICIKAYELLKKNHPQLPAVKIHLHKVIPSGAGLGGGSSDASHTLALLNNKYGLGLSTEKLIDYAALLGSDCPFFIINNPCYATGRGEILQRVNIDLSQYKLLIVNPGIHIDTAWAFTKISPAVPSKSIPDIIKQPVETWEKSLINDFEKPVFEAYPEIEKIKKELYNQGAAYASMSGSGSTVYGLFSKASAIQTDKFGNYFHKILDLPENKIA